MNKTTFTAFLAPLLMVFAVGKVVADDIDLFVGAPPSTAAAPNVLIVLDNTANWNAPFVNEKAALVSVINSLEANRFRVGLMLFTETGGADRGNDGAYVRAAIRPFTAANKVLYQNLVNGLDVGADKSNGGKVAKAMEEAYLYYSAGTPHSGNQKAKTDYFGNSTGTLSSQAIYAVTGNALASKNATTYNNPIADGCAKNFIIYISNGAAQDNNSDKTQATNALAAAGGSTAEIPISPSGSMDNPADQWTRFMKKSSLGITTYTVDINKVTTGQGPGWTALLKSMAGVSGGKYFDVANDSAAIANALNSIFSEIQSVNSVFASVSLPVSVNTQGTYLNQVYVGMFRPDPGSRPLWPGNLKQYKLGYPVGSNTLKLLDATSASAVNNNTGFIGECARSFWTPSSVNTYWGFKPQGDCLTVSNSAASDSPDGNVVEKGAQGFMLRNVGNVTGRTMKTCGLTSCAALSAFDAAAVSASDLGVSTNTERDELISWAQGKDRTDENVNAVTTGEMRPSVHGDVVHSRPVAINYGTDNAGGRQVVVYYGGNDGVLHAINGNRPDTDNINIGGKAPGQELWSFVPPEFYPKFKRLRDNSTLISYPGQTAPDPLPVGWVVPKAKDYGVDGPIAAYKSTTAAWVFATLRRGGRHIYAFDVTTPGTPSLLWRKGCPNAANDTGCSTGFDGIGQTWSTPKVVKAASAPTTPLLLVGGGYDVCEDTDSGTANNSCTATKGNKIFLMNAASGALLQTFTTDRGVVADLVVVPDSSGLIKQAYAVDLGGNIYRISGASATTNVGTTAPGSWTMTKIASLGCATTATCTANRKFMFAPSVVEDGLTNYILVGSGDREKPLLSYVAASSVANYFFMVKDMPADSGWLSSESSNCSSSIICLNSLTPIADSSTPDAATLAASKGWSLSLAGSEQVVTSAITVFDNVTFSTHQPRAAVSGQCSNLGEARVYNINYEDAAPRDTLRFENISGDGLPPSPVAGLVTLDDGSTVPFCIGCSGDSPLEGGEPEMPGTAGQPKAHVFWNIEK